MTPAARIQAAIELLDEVIVAARENGAPADGLAQRFFKARRYAGSKDRRAIRDLAWSAIRRFGECPAAARPAFLTIADEDADMAALFGTSDYGPAAIGEDEPRASGGAIPQWILPHLSGHVTGAERDALLMRAPLDLRVNRLKGGRDEALTALPDAVALPGLAFAMRLPTGFAIEQHPLMIAGKAEIQDYGSQMIVAACRAQPGMTILDLCAGAGGKTLALSADMNSEGRLIASDTNRARLGQLTPRAQRGGADNIEICLLNPGKERAMLSEFNAGCDLVLVDAPCSGSGTWRRNPETRWRLTPDRLEKVMADQARLLDIASAMVAPGGHLVYAVCSLLSGEGAQQIAQFLRNNSGWRAGAIDLGRGRAEGDGLLLTPFHDETDGFFMARLEKL